MRRTRIRLFEGGALKRGLAIGLRGDGFTERVTWERRQ